MSFIAVIEFWSHCKIRAFLTLWFNLRPTGSDRKEKENDLAWTRDKINWPSTNHPTRHSTRRQTERKAEEREVGGQHQRMDRTVFRSDSQKNSPWPLQMPGDCQEVSRQWCLYNQLRVRRLVMMMMEETGDVISGNEISISRNIKMDASCGRLPRLPLLCSQYLL